MIDLGNSLTIDIYPFHGADKTNNHLKGIIIQIIPITFIFKRRIYDMWCFEITNDKFNTTDAWYSFFCFVLSFTLLPFNQVYYHYLSLIYGSWPVYLISIHSVLVLLINLLKYVFDITWFVCVTAWLINPI